MNISKEFIEQVLSEIVEKFLIPRFKDLGMNASGQWIDSLSVEYDGKNGIIKGQDYTKYLVEGRPGGTMPPINVLIDWVQNKLGLSGQEAVNVAWAVGMKIKREGTDYYPNGTDLLEVLQSPEVTTYFNARVSGYLIEEIKLTFNRELKKL